MFVRPHGGIKQSASDWQPLLALSLLHLYYKYKIYI